MTKINRRTLVASASALDGETWRLFGDVLVNEST
jgi:hypothetical protein